MRVSDHLLNLISWSDGFHQESKSTFLAFLEQSIITDSNTASRLKIISHGPFDDIIVCNCEKLPVKLTIKPCNTRR